MSVPVAIVLPASAANPGADGCVTGCLTKALLAEPSGSLGCQRDEHVFQIGLAGGHIDDRQPFALDKR